VGLHRRAQAAPLKRFKCYARPQAQAVSWVTEQQHPAAPLDAVVVLAGVLTPDGGLPEWVTRRLDAACDLHAQQGSRPPILCLGERVPAACLSPLGQPPCSPGTVPRPATAASSPHGPATRPAGAGTPHKPPVLSATRYVIHEATSCARWARGPLPQAQPQAGAAAARPERYVPSRAAAGPHPTNSSAARLNHPPAHPPARLAAAT
jgi:hypothetical protein